MGFQKLVHSKWRKQFRSFCRLKIRETNCLQTVTYY